MQLPLFMGGLLLFAFITAISIIYQAKWISIIVDQAVFEQKAFSISSPVFKWLILFICMRGVIQFLYQFTADKVGSRIIHGMRVNIFEKILPLIASRTGGFTSAGIATLFTDKLDAIKQYYTQYIAQAILSAMIPITVLFFIFPLDWITGIVFLITAPLIPFFMMLIGSQSKKATEYRWGYLSRLADHFADHIRGMEVLKQFNQSRKSLNEIERVSTRFANMTMDILKITFLSALALELLTTLSTAVVAVEIGLRLLSSGIEFQTAFFILLIAPEFYLPLRLLGLKFHAGMTGQTAAIEFYEVLGKVMQHEQLENVEEVALDEKVSLEFQNISFHYADDQREVLHDVSFSCAPGTVTALIGRSGSGKSTLAKLALRFVEPEHGQVLMNGISAEEISLKHWYQQLAWIGQKSFYAEGSILENIQFANPAADEERVRQVLMSVGLIEKITQLPEGLQTPMDEFGSNFSGGELQRLQLGRALISPSPILILDEPTSQMDPDLEKLFINELTKIKRKKTILLIAHRLQTVMNADQILVLENGKIIEQGGHLALMQQQGRYAAMVDTYQRLR